MTCKHAGTNAPILRVHCRQQGSAKDTWRNQTWSDTRSREGLSPILTPSCFPAVPEPPLTIRVEDGRDEAHGGRRAGIVVGKVDLQPHAHMLPARSRRTMADKAQATGRTQHTHRTQRLRGVTGVCAACAGGTGPQRIARQRRKVSASGAAKMRRGSSVPDAGGVAKADRSDSSRRRYSVRRCALHVSTAERHSCTDRRATPAHTMHHHEHAAERVGELLVAAPHTYNSQPTAGPPGALTLCRSNHSLQARLELGELPPHVRR